MKLLPRTLWLTSPYMHGDDVLAVQKRLGAVRTKDGVYGPITANAVKDWKYRVGFPLKFVNQSLTASDWKYLSGQWPRTLAMKVRTASRLRSKEPASVVGKQAKAVAIMAEWAGQGLKEIPAHSNKVPRLQEIGRGHNVRQFYSNMGYPWCAYAVMLAALGAGSSTADKGLRQGLFNPLYVPEIWYLAQRGQYGFRAVDWADAQPGDFVIFNWDGGVPDHIGILKYRGSQSCTCIEGNTAPSSAGSQSNGGGVYVRDRSRAVIQGFVRWS